MYKEDTFWRLGEHFFTEKNDYTKNYSILYTKKYSILKTPIF